MKIINILTLLFIIALQIGCSTDESKKKTELEKIEAEEAVEEINPLDLLPDIPYNLVEIKNKQTIDSILTSLPDSVDRKKARKILMTLNRKEFRFIRNGESIIVPEYFTGRLLDYSIFPPEYPAAKNIEQILMVSIPYQAYACYEYGKLVRFAATNSGKETTPSFPGRYALVWKDRIRRSSLDSNWILPFTYNFHSEAGSAFHQFEMPGRPVSHSCLRQFLDDSEWLYNWGKGVKRDTAGKPIPMSGTPVILLGHFDYTRKQGGSWLELRSNKDGIVQLPDNPLDIEEALIPIIQIPETSRPALRNREQYVNAEETLRKRGIIREGVNLIPSVDYNKKRRLKRAEEARKKEEEEKLRLQELESLEETENTIEEVQTDTEDTPDNEN